eukprot:6268746-Heterocapsa_arctica.AAC.1
MAAWCAAVSHLLSGAAQRPARHCEGAEEPASSAGVPSPFARRRGGEHAGDQVCQVSADAAEGWRL